MNTATRVKKTNILVPASLAEANLLLGQIGVTQNGINEIEKKLKDEIAKLESEAEKKIRSLEIARNNQVDALFSFANSRRPQLTMKAKSVALGTGSFGWRMSTLRVKINKDDEEMIKYLKKIGKCRYIRIKEEIDRQALLAEKPKIPGIDYVQNDEFFVVPRTGKRSKTITKAIDR